jgi:hypothetical protein
MGKKNKKKKLSQAVRNVGAVLSNKEAKKVAKATGKSVAQVVAKATSKGVGIGSNLGNRVSKAVANPYGSLGQKIGTFQAKPQVTQALAPLAGLSLNKGTAYYGSSTTTTPASSSRTPNGGVTQRAATTTYNPIVLPRGTATAGGSGGGGGGGGGGSNSSGDGSANDGTFDAIKDLYQQQIDEARAAQEAYANQVAEQINAMQLDFGDQLAATQTAADNEIAYLNDLMMMQNQQAAQTQDMLAQQAAAAEAAYAEQARQAAALGRAFVPALEPTAASVQLGDQRKTQREEANNTLSSLAITSSIGSNSNPLAGLQLA